ncbi:hypothetical protein ACI77M_10070 [Pseudomonas fildesensis]|uniref:hypothetical protein n=1 Tax=Pseudomonas fildesensis TaxID=1674920 RepID=UPI00387B438F
MPALVDADKDVIIAVTTAADNTEAAFLPILTNLLNIVDLPGAVLYISPEDSNGGFPFTVADQ